MTADQSPQRYEIRVKGHLGVAWVAWFDGLTISNEDDGTSVISGPVADQAALHGLLHKLRDLGLSLESLVQLAPGASAGVGGPEVPTSHSNPSGASS
jgi:hypothetical protein